jgi:Activator of Hsp90 ATPase homolog 1-like protein
MGENEAHDVIVTRKFDAPRERIWRAWSDPDEVMKWWGPQGFTSPMCRMGSARETPRWCACVRTRAGSCITRGRTCRSSRWSGSSSTKDSRTKTVTKSPCRARPPPRDPGGGVIVFSSTISYSSSSTCSPNWLYELNVPSAQNLCECSIGPAASAHGCLGSLAGTFRASSGARHPRRIGQRTPAILASRALGPSLGRYSPVATRRRLGRGRELRSPRLSMPEASALDSAPRSWSRTRRIRLPIGRE